MGGVLGSLLGSVHARLVSDLNISRVLQPCYGELVGLCPCVRLVSGPKIARGSAAVIVGSWLGLINAGKRPVVQPEGAALAPSQPFSTFLTLAVGRSLQPGSVVMVATQRSSPPASISGALLQGFPCSPGHLCVVLSGQGVTGRC